jgi:hypothetical protein
MLSETAETSEGLRRGNAPAQAKTVGEVQSPGAMTMMSQPGTFLYEPSKDEMWRWLDWAKDRVSSLNP